MSLNEDGHIFCTEFSSSSLPDFFYLRQVNLYKYAKEIFDWNRNRMLFEIPDILRNAEKCWQFCFNNL